MTTGDQQAFLDETGQNRGYTLEMHHIMAANDLEWAKKYNQFIEATYTGPVSYTHLTLPTILLV